MNKLMMLGFALVILSGIALADLAFDFGITGIISSFTVALTGTLTQQASVSSAGQFKYFLADGSGFSDTPTAGTILWNSSITNGNVIATMSALNEANCDVKLVWNGTQYDVNSSAMSVALPVTSTGQVLSMGAKMNSNGRCNGTLKDLNILVTG